MAIKKDDPFAGLGRGNLMRRIVTKDSGDPFDAHDLMPRLVQPDPQTRAYLRVIGELESKVKDQAGIIEAQESTIRMAKGEVDALLARIAELEAELAQAYKGQERAKVPKPWEVEGIPRATYYYNLKKKAKKEKEAQP
jgi:hypothetical protein